MIKQIITKDFMGVTGRENTDVSQFTAFTGLNGAGKSTRLSAVMVTLQGYLSKELGLKPVKTMELSRANEMIVGVELDNNKRYERVFSVAGKSATTTVRVDGEDVPTREGDGIIKNDLGDLPVMFNLGEFESLSPEKKKQFLFSISDSISDIDDRDVFFAMLRYELMKQIIDESTPDNLLKFKMDLDSFEDLPKEKYKEYFKVLDSQLDPDIVEYVDAITDSFIDRFTSAPQVLFDTLAKVVAEEETYQKRTVKENAATRDKLAEVAGEIDGKKAELETIDGEIKEAHEKKDEINGRIEKNKASIQHVKDVEDIKTRLSEKIADDEKFLAENEDLTQVIESVESLEKEHEKAVSVRSDKNGSLDALKEDYDKDVATLKELRAEKGVLTKTIASLKSVKGHCVLSELVPCNEDFSSSISESETRIAELDEEIGPLKVSTEKMATQIKELRESLVDSDNMITSMEEALHLQKTDLAVTKDRRKNILATLDSNKAELAEIEKRKLPAVLDEQILSGEFMAIKNRIILLDERKTSIVRAEASFKALSDSLLKSKSASQKLEVAIALRKTINELRNQLLAKAVEPLVKTINGLMQKVDPTFSVRIDLDTGFKLSVLRGETWQPFSSLSGGESLLFAIALLVAIILSANPPLKVLALEAAELDRNNLKTVMDALPSIAGDIDNVLLAYPDDKVKAVDGWSIVSL